MNFFLAVLAMKNQFFTPRLKAKGVLQSSMCMDEDVCPCHALAPSFLDESSPNLVGMMMGEIEKMYFRIFR